MALGWTFVQGRMRCLQVQRSPVRRVRRRLPRHGLAGDAEGLSWSTRRMSQKSGRHDETRWRSVKSPRYSPTANTPSALSVGHVAVDRLTVLADTADAQPATPPSQGRRNHHHHHRGSITEPNLFRVELVRQRGALGRQFGILFVGPARRAPCPLGRSGARSITRPHPGTQRPTLARASVRAQRLSCFARRLEFDRWRCRVCHDALVVAAVDYEETAEVGPGRDRHCVMLSFSRGGSRRWQ